MDGHLQGAAALHAPLPYKQHMDRISSILGCRRVIMFLCASRLPSFAPGRWPSHGSKSQVTAGCVESVDGAGRGRCGPRALERLVDFSHKA